MKAKRPQTKTDRQGAGHGTSSAQNVVSKPPAFVMRLPLPAKLGAGFKSSQMVFEKTVNGQRFQVVQTVVANCHAKTQAATRAAIRRLADWPSIPATAQPKRWVH